jgi:hypothetical protein
MAPLLASASVLIGHARWVQATSGWCEPPHLWLGEVGDSGTGKSPGSDCLLRDVLPEIERRMLGDFPERLLEWRANVEMYEARQDSWKADVREAQRRNHAAPMPPAEMLPPEPQAPRLRQNDVTVPKLAVLLGTTASKGLLVIRDELTGWLNSMTAYNDADREFWIEAYGGRPFRVERQKNPHPIIIPRLAVAVFGGTQPEKLASLFKAADDGLFSRFAWVWPEPLPFHLASEVPNAQWAIDSLDRLRLLDLAHMPGSDETQPIYVPLTEAGRSHLEAFGQEMQALQNWAGGLMRSAYGKARGLALRLALVLEFLWWAGREGMEPPPDVISDRAFLAAAQLVADYFMPMAERVYGDAAATTSDRNAATLARWILKKQPREVYVRYVLREVRLHGLKRAADVHEAAEALIEAEWLEKPEANSGKRPRMAYPVNPALWKGSK